MKARIRSEMYPLGQGTVRVWRYTVTIPHGEITGSAITWRVAMHRVKELLAANTPRSYGCHVLPQRPPR